MNLLLPPCLLQAVQAAIEACDRLRHQGLQDGVMDILLAWDVNETAPSSQRLVPLPRLT